MQTALIGVDVGTTNVKAAVYTPDGHELIACSRRLEVLHPRPDWSEYDCEGIWAAVKHVLHSAMAEIDPSYVPRAIAVSSMAETAIPLDSESRPVHNAIAWFDTRTSEQMEWLFKEISQERLFAITGLSAQPIFGINKMLWIRQHAPEAFAKLRRWLNVADYIAFKLSGQQATDKSLAARTMMLDLAAGSWSDDVLAAANLSGDLLAPTVWGGTPLGRILPDVAGALGLPTDLVVVSGGHDHPCAAAGSGVVAPGVVLDSLGTTETLLMVTPAPIFKKEIASLGFQQGCHVVPDRFVCSGGLYTSGACVDWVREVLLPDADAAMAYRQLEELASASAPGSYGVFFLPYLRMASAPYNDPLARASFLGITANTSRGDLARSVLEGMAFESHQSLVELEKAFEIPSGPIRAVGGPARNRLFVEIRAALARNSFATLENAESASRGAALLAGVGAGIYADMDDAVRVAPASEKVVNVEEGLAHTYGQLYSNVYKYIYPSISKFNSLLAGPMFTR